MNINTKENVKIAYIGGGSRGWAWMLMSDLAGQDLMSGTVTLYDIDKDAAAQNKIIGNKISDLPEAKSHWVFETAETIREVLTGADFVVISILPGTFKEMKSDVHTPEKYGIYQSVGDTTGPGGVLRAIRTIPMFVEFAKAIEQYAPQAWVINYTNPMSLSIAAMYRAFPKIKAFGCCHEVFGTQKLLCKMLEDMQGTKGLTNNDIKVNVFGINHFTWIDKASYGNLDLMPLYREFTDKYYEEGFIVNESEHWMNNVFESANRVKFDLFKRYGVIAAAGDRHLAEFCPPWYLKNPETIREFKFGLTSVSWRVEDLQDRLERGRKLSCGEVKPVIQRSDEQGVFQMAALLGLGDLTTNVNVPNVGQIHNLPLGAVVETNAIFSENSLKPIMAGNIPVSVQSLIYRQVINQQITLDGVLSKDYEVIFNAFANDPLVCCSLGDAKKLFNEMVENTSEYRL